jgi:two-component system, sensor histidine kinase and response regulator
MIVDDDRTTVTLLKTLLELDGFEVDLAADADVAFQQADNAPPDAFLVDYHLAETDGTDFVKKLRATPRFTGTPVIMTSGLNRATEATEAGANEFLIKPFDPGDLVALLRKVIA